MTIHLNTYEIARNELIPVAVKYANKRHGDHGPKGQEDRETWAAEWNRTYHSKMNRLAGHLFKTQPNDIMFDLWGI